MSLGKICGTTGGQTRHVLLFFFKVIEVTRPEDWPLMAM